MYGVIRFMFPIQLCGLIIFFCEVVSNITLFYFIAKRYRRTKLLVVAILSSLYIVFIAFIAIELLFFLINFNNPVNAYLDVGNNFFTSLLPFFGGISAGIFLLFIEYFRNERINPIHMGIYGVFLGAFILNLLYHSIIPETVNISELTPPLMTNDVQELFYFFLSFLFSTNFPAPYFVGYVVIITLYSLNQINKLIAPHEKIQKRQIKLMEYSIIFYYLFTLLLVVSGNILRNITPPDVQVFLKHFAPHITVLLGHYTMFQAYVKAPIGFLQFQRNEKILVMNQSGIPLFSYDFEDFNQEKIFSTHLKGEQDLLLSGGVYAVLSLFRDMIQTTNIKLIQFEKKQLMLAYNDNFITFLIVDRVSQFLWSALESFCRMFNLRYGNEAGELTVVPVYIFDDAVELVALAFGRK